MRPVEFWWQVEQRRDQQEDFGSMTRAEVEQIYEEEYGSGSR